MEVWHSLRYEMTAYLSNSMQNQMYLILGPTHQIIGRINVNPGKNNVAAIGYRLAEKNTGKRVLSQALLQLCPILKHDYSLHTLEAFAAHNNPASVRTLLHAGFSECAEEIQKVTHNGQCLNLQKFQKSL